MGGGWLCFGRGVRELPPRACALERGAARGGRQVLAISVCGGVLVAYLLARAEAVLLQGLGGQANGVMGEGDAAKCACAGLVWTGGVPESCATRVSWRRAAGGMGNGDAMV